MRKKRKREQRCLTRFLAKKDAWRYITAAMVNPVRLMMERVSGEKMTLTIEELAFIELKCKEITEVEKRRKLECYSLFQDAIAWHLLQERSGCYPAG